LAGAVPEIGYFHAAAARQQRLTRRGPPATQRIVAICYRIAGHKGVFRVAGTANRKTRAPFNRCARFFLPTNMAGMKNAL